MTDVPDTVTEAIRFLVAAGYQENVRLVAGGLECDSVDGATTPPKQ
jgi:hypothetical protein